jgi:hypothetical protein
LKHYKSVHPLPILLKQAKYTYKQRQWVVVLGKVKLMVALVVLVILLKVALVILLLKGLVKLEENLLKGVEVA